jgi:hypothetical protein
MYPSEPLVRRVMEAKAYHYNGLRKIVQGLDWEIDKIPEVTYESIGYSKNKLRQLERNYVNLEELERVRSILSKRRGQSFTSVALSTRGAKKDSRSMGWCMLAIVVTRTGKDENVEIHYRSTELILKFGGDLCFLPSVFERLEINPTKVRFRFANAFFSGVFLPTLLASQDRPLAFLNKMYRVDPKHFQMGTRFLLRACMKKGQRFPYSPENQQNKFLWSRMNHIDIEQMREFLIEKHETFGRPLPEAHEDHDE